MTNEELPQNIWFVDQILPHEDDLRNWLHARFSIIPNVDDVIQEAYERIIKAHASGPIANPRAYLFVTARNIALNLIRRYQFEAPPGDKEYESVEITDPTANPLESAVHSEEIRLLIDALRCLPTRCRQIMVLRKIYGLSQKEVASMLGIAEHTVEVQGRIGFRKCVQYFDKKKYTNRFSK